MFGLRKLGKVLRGKVTPPQIVMATVLGGLLGFVPGFALVSNLGGGFMQAPGLILALVFAVLVLNANLAVFGLTLLVAKLVSVVMLPVSFAIGRALLDGPTEPLFRAMINAPVLAWFGLERYATTGGLVVGLLFGLCAGFVLVRAVRGFRAKMANAEEGSERYRQLMARRSVRFLTWLLLGRRGNKRTYREMLENRRKGSPIRVAGVAVVVVTVVALWAGHAFLSGPALRNAAQVALERYNGATVDLAEARVELGAGRVVVKGLGMADPNELRRDTFRARTLELALGTRDLLQKRLVIDTIRSSEASTGAERTQPGRRAVADAAPPPPPEPEGDEKTLGDWLQDAKTWQRRLQQVSRWIDRLTGSGDAAEVPAEERARRVEAQAREHGLAGVVASHLIDGAPLVLVRELVLEGVEAIRLDGGERIDVRGTNLSSHPWLAEGPLELSIAARSGRFGFTFRYDPARPDAATTKLSYRGLPVDTIAAQLSAAPIKGGTIDVEIDGTLDCSRAGGPWIDLPMVVHLRDTTLVLDGVDEAQVAELTVPIGLRGPLAAPRVSLDDGALGDALIAAGRKELATQVRARAQALLGDRVPGVGGEIGDGLGDVVSGDKTPEQLLDEAKRRAEETAKREAEERAKRALQERTQDAAQDALKKLPGGLFGGKKKDGV